MDILPGISDLKPRKPWTGWHTLEMVTERDKELVLTQKEMPSALEPHERMAELVRHDGNTPI